MTVSVPGPWGQYEVSKDIDVGHRYRHVYHRSNNETYKEYFTDYALTRDTKVRSGNTSGTVVRGHWMPNPASGTLIHQTRTYNDRLYRPKYGSLDTHYSQPWGFWPAYAAWNISDYASEFEPLVKRADTEALARINNQKMELGVTLAESRKTIGHLASVATRLFKAYRNVRRGNFSAVARELGLPGTRRSVKTAATHWLEYNYAWRPLIMDVKAAYDIAQNGLEPANTFKVERNVKGSLSVPVAAWEPTETTYSGVDLIVGELTDHDMEIEIGVRTIFHGELDSAELQRLKMLGLINPVTVAWELVPFSFVFDWFVPVGTFLNACTATFGLKFLSGTRTKWLKINHSHQSMSSQGSWNRRNYNLSTQTLKKFQYSRSVLTDYPTPSLFFGRGLTSNRLITAASLFETIADTESRHRIRKFRI